MTKGRHNAWMTALGRDPKSEHLSSSNVVCSAHFNEEDKVYTSKSIRLKSNAVPTLRLKKRSYLVEKQGCFNR